MPAPLRSHKKVTVVPTPHWRKRGNAVVPPSTFKHHNGKQLNLQTQENCQLHDTIQSEPHRATPSGGYHYLTPSPSRWFESSLSQISTGTMSRSPSVTHGGTKSNMPFSPHLRFSPHTEQETQLTQLPSTSSVSTVKTLLYSEPTTASLSLQTGTPSPTPTAPPTTPVRLSRPPAGVGIAAKKALSRQVYV